MPGRDCAVLALRQSHYPLGTLTRTDVPRGARLTPPVEAEGFSRRFDAFHLFSALYYTYTVI